MWANPPGCPPPSSGSRAGAYCATLLPARCPSASQPCSRRFRYRPIRPIHSRTAPIVAGAAPRPVNTASGDSPTASPPCADVGRYEFSVPVGPVHRAEGADDEEQHGADDGQLTQTVDRKAGTGESDPDQERSRAPGRVAEFRARGPPTVWRRPRSRLRVLVSHPVPGLCAIKRRPPKRPTCVPDTSRILMTCR